MRSNTLTNVAYGSIFAARLNKTHNYLNAFRSERVTDDRDVDLIFVPENRKTVDSLVTIYKQNGKCILLAFFNHHHCFMPSFSRRQ